MQSAPSFANSSSVLNAAGIEAARSAEMFWVMTLGGSVIWVLVLALAAYAVYSARTGRPWSKRRSLVLIAGGGLIAPTLVLSALLFYGLSHMTGVKAQGDGLRILVTGERWWWRVRYQRADGVAVDLANEIRLPRGARIEVLLDTPDILHSFWIPSLAGKIDMIPGRATRLLLEPTRSGIFRGICAEYCGTAHAHMAFAVEVMEPAAFSNWLDAQNRDARAPDHEQTRLGRQHFLAYGCGACHKVRGTEAVGAIGPDLTHVGGRRSLAAGTLPMNEAAMRKWIAHPQDVKPGALMPAFNWLREEESGAIAGYLLSLE